MSDTTVVTPASTDSGLSGLIVALVLVALVLAGGFMWYRYYGTGKAAPAPAGTTNINVTVPTPATGNDATQ